MATLNPNSCSSFADIMEDRTLRVTLHKVYSNRSGFNVETNGEEADKLLETVFVDKPYACQRCDEEFEAVPYSFVAEHLRIHEAKEEEETLRKSRKPDNDGGNVVKRLLSGEPERRRIERNSGDNAKTCREKIKIATRWDDASLVNRDSRRVRGKKWKSSANAAKIRIFGFPCDRCRKIFRTSEALKKHDLSVKCPRDARLALPYECATCARRFRTARRLEEHERIHGVERPSYACDKCSKRFYADSALALHLRQVHAKRLKCDVCAKRFAYPSQLEMHSSAHKKRRTFVCVPCDKEFLTKDCLRKHADRHRYAVDHVCVRCEKRFTTANALKTHADSSTCDACGEHFPNSIDLARHSRVHDDAFVSADRPVELVPPAALDFVCSVCPKGFATRVKLASHLTTHDRSSIRSVCDSLARQVSRRVGGRKRTKPSTADRFECKKCSRSFATANYLKVHDKIHTREKPYACKICDRRFRTRTNLNVHRLVHEPKKFHCTICRKSFKHKHTFKYHLLTHRDGAFKCDECAKTFTAEFLLKRHRRRHADRDENRFRCSSCGKCYSSGAHLSEHVRAIHAGEEPYACSYCERTFRYRTSLVMHTRARHTIGKNHKCDACDREFTENCNLLRHRRTAHGVGERIGYPCSDCPKMFTCAASLSRHAQKHLSSDKQYGCSLCEKFFWDRSSMIRHHGLKHTN